MPQTDSRASPQRRADFPHVLEIPTRWADNDQYGHINNAQFYEFVDSAVNAHLLIAKSHDGTVTHTGVMTLNEAERREEIARMLSGATITDEARAQAERLLEAA